MWNRKKLNNMKELAVAQANDLGHRLERFNKYKDDEVYCSAFCSRCSGYLRVTAFEISGRPVEETCQRHCSCDEILLSGDLDGKCRNCRGDELALYPKTPAVRAKDASFIAYCRKKNKDYEPSPGEMSDFFWRCLHCANRLGPGYNGEPDERGYCLKCAESDQAWEIRKAEIIEAAGGLKAWNRKKKIAKILTPFDYAAILVSMLAGGAIALFLLGKILVELLDLLEEGLKSRGGNLVLFIVIVLSGAWVWIRWKALHEKPPPF